jgi:TetR/AcrR family transcriptional repressor of nem operon
MRYEKGHKELTRQRIIETASVRFRRDGIENVGVADVMKDAGLTHGGFYSHFKSKEDLVRAALEASGERGRCNFRERVAESGLEGWIRHYLRTGNLDHPERGCHIASLAGELARHPAGTRAVVAKRIATFFAEIASHLPSGIPNALRHQVAIGIFGTLIGSLQLARVAGDESAATEVLEAGIASALRLAGIKSAHRN